MNTGDDLDGVAERLLDDAGLERGGPVCVVSLVRRLLGPCALRFAPEGALPGNGALVRVGAEWRIYIRKTAPDHVKRFVALHEVAHWALGSAATEEQCNRLAGALLLPRREFLGALRSRSRIGRLATAFGSDETCAWLRLGELTGAPVAVLSPRRFRSRGATFAWPAEQTLREGRFLGVKKAHLSDDCERLVLRPTTARGATA